MDCDDVEVVDVVMERFDHHSHVLSKVPDFEMLPVAVVAAKCIVY